MGNIETIIYTNENHINILNVTLPRFVKFLKPINSNINIVTNKFVNNTNINFNDVNIIETNINFDPQGSHFRDSMLIALTSIKSEYVLFFCDDYMLNSMIKIDMFNKVKNIINHYNCDFLSFSSLAYIRHYLEKWLMVNPDLKEFGIEGGILYEINENYRHLYSVQPCIWKKESLIKLLENNDYLTLHMLDNTIIKNKKGLLRNLNYETDYYDVDGENNLDYGFKNYTIHLPPLSFNIDDRNLNSDYFVFDYGEILRHGKIVDSKTNSVNILMSYLDDNPKIKEKIFKFL
jgi:hypothetical protein